MEIVKKIEKGKEKQFRDEIDKIFNAGREFYLGNLDRVILTESISIATSKNDPIVYIVLPNDLKNHPARIFIEAVFLHAVVNIFEDYEVCIVFGELN